MLSEVESEKAYRAAWWQINGVGVKTFLKLMMLGSGKRAWQTSDSELVKFLGETKTTQSILEQKKRVDPINSYKDVIKMGVKIYCYGVDEDYPVNLGGIQEPPPVLYVRGKLKPEDVQAVAIVGTRKPTSYGVMTTKRMTTGLVLNKFTIVSGLARGIDGVAHRQALESGGRTIAVLGGGIDRIFPPEHERLASDIVKSGAIISMLAPGQPSLRGFFAVRNRFIAGLSLGVLVTEGAVKSGTRITVNYAIDQSKPVYAVPGEINKPMSKGPVEMIKNGAQLVTDPEDVVKDLGIRTGVMQTSKNGPNLDLLSDIQLRIWKLLEEGGLEIDEISRKGDIGIEILGVELTLMEMEGWLVQVDGKYQIS